MNETNFRFANPEYLYALAGILVFVGACMWFRYIRAKKRKALADAHLLPVVLPDFSPIRFTIKCMLIGIAYICIVLALARPQFGMQIDEVKKRGIELVIALDVSNSMLAQDVKPSRLERAKLSIQNIINKLNDDKIAIVVFAGDAYIQLPLTTDIHAAKMFLQSISTGTVSKQGTAIGAAITKSLRSFTDNPKTGKAIIIISDGENHEDDAQAEARKAVDLGVVIHSVGMGSPQGAIIPRSQGGFVEDRSGRPVTTKLNEMMLQEIAQIGNGVYSREDFSPVIKAIDGMTKTEFETKQFSKYDEKFPYFLLVAVVCLCLEFLLLERKNKWLKQFDIFTVKN
ncbi:MAG TPA: VWA domain-containing protein [Bacteroidales bacterium]|nr:VWA domain-containing protein [Bacteroidales bacterium]